MVGTSRCDVPDRAIAGGTNAMNQGGIAPLNAARTAQRAIPTKDSVKMHPGWFGVEYSLSTFGYFWLPVAT